MKNKRKKRKLFDIKNKKMVIIVIALFIVIATFGPSLARFVLDVYNNHILESKGFYFDSSVMTSLGANRSINNWDGVNAYQLSIDVTNRKNDMIWTKSDITYDIEVTCSSNIRCVLNKNNGTIYENTHTDRYMITIYPIGNFSTNQVATVETKATSTYPYVKEISVVYNISVEKSKFSYKINDEAGNKYFILELTNAITYYKVIEAFSSYSVGDNLSIDDYNLLSNEDKSKCLSAEVTLEFDPNLVLLDMTDETYLRRLNSSYQTITINGFEYVKKFAFRVDASSTTKILFYKTDSTNDYTYPGDTSIINVNVYSVEDIS